MPNYIYKAKSFNGETKVGITNAKDEFQLAQSLKNEGMVLIKAEPQEKHDKSRFEINLPFLGVSAAEKIMLTRNLGVMFSTGLSLVKSFDILAIQAKNKKLKKALLDIKERISRGDNLSDVLANYPDIFSELFVNMIKVGEESGTLEDILQILSLQLSKEHELSSKIKNAMIYPSIIMMVMLAVGIVIITIVLPSLNIFFTSLAVPIPIYTQILLSGGAFISNNWYWLILALFAFIGAVFYIIRTKKGKEALDGLLLKTPVISQIVKKNNSAFMIRSLSSLVASGVPLTKSLEISAKTTNNYYFKQALITAGEKIRKRG